MRNTPNVRAECYRIRQGPMASDGSYGNNGAFAVPVGGVTLTVIASDEDGWDHVSASLPGRCPTWEEMCAVKDLFFKDDEAVVQYHPPKAAHVNVHRYCLHLWRPQGAVIPMPPGWMVGPADLTAERVERMSEAGRLALWEQATRRPTPPPNPESPPPPPT